jgi:hypothetical protein
MNWPEANELGKAETVRHIQHRMGVHSPSPLSISVLTLTSMSNLAEVLNRQAKDEEAEKMHRQALGLERDGARQRVSFHTGEHEQPDGSAGTPAH